MQKTLHREVEELLTDYDIKSQECSLASEDKKVKKNFMHVLVCYQTSERFLSHKVDMFTWILVNWWAMVSKGKGFDI